MGLLWQHEVPVVVGPAEVALEVQRSLALAEVPSVRYRVLVPRPFGICSG